MVQGPVVAAQDRSLGWHAACTVNVIHATEEPDFPRRTAVRISELMTKDVKCCNEDDSVNTAAGLMWDGDCGIVPVVAGDGQLVGVITDRDACMAAYTRGLSLSAIRVGDVMAREPRACAPADAVSEAEDIMRLHRIRRLPVVDHGRVVGILSLNDIARAAARQPRAVAPQGVAGTLAAISMPRADQPAAAHLTSTAGV